MSSAEDPVTEVVDLRCPVALHGECQPGNLLAKLQLTGEQPSFVHPDNLIEMACSRCRTHLRKAGRRVTRVLHRYDFSGDLIQTLIVE